MLEPGLSIHLGCLMIENKRLLKAQLVVASPGITTQIAWLPFGRMGWLPGGRMGFVPGRAEGCGQQELSVRLLRSLAGGKEPEAACLEGRAGRSRACCLGSLVIPVSRRGGLIVFAAGCLPRGMPVVEGKVFPWL